MTMITPSYLGETIEYSSLHACRSTLEDPTCLVRLNPVSLRFKQDLGEFVLLVRGHLARTWSFRQVQSHPAEPIRP